MVEGARVAVVARLTDALALDASTMRAARRLGAKRGFERPVDLKARRSAATRRVRKTIRREGHEHVVLDGNRCLGEPRARELVGVVVAPVALLIVGSVNGTGQLNSVRTSPSGPAACPCRS